MINSSERSIPHRGTVVGLATIVVLLAGATAWPAEEGDAPWNQLPSPWETLASYSEAATPMIQPQMPPNNLDFLTSEQPSDRQGLIEFVTEKSTWENGVTPYKAGFFQSLSLRHTWLAKVRGNGFGLHHSQAQLAVALPAPRRDWPLLIMTTFGVYDFAGPNTPAMPNQVFDASLRFLWLPQLSKRWRAILGVSPGVYSDFEHSQSDSIRIKGVALARFDWVPGRLQVAFGAVYLDRRDFSLIPAVGITWTPNADTIVELTLPRPKFARRLDWDEGMEDWIYLAGELGGESWTIRPTPGVHRQVTLRDFRVLTGFERRMDGGAGFHVEAGYVFGRELRFESPTQVVDGGSTVLLRAGVSW